MSCDTPSTTSDCTTPANCGGGCGCSETTGTPVLPKCQDINLTAGTFTHATVVVNSTGCITSVTSGEPELYTPDECCGGGSGGSGGAGPRGPKGDPGSAATIEVNTVIGAGTTWSVENTGTTSAAVFKFTAPAPTSSGSTPSGATGEINGLKVESGLVKTLPLGLITQVTFAPAGTNASLISALAVPDLTVPGKVALSINLDLLISNLRDEYTAQNTAQANTISDLTAAVSDLVNSVTTLQSTLTSQQSTLTSQQSTLTSQQNQITTMSTELIDLRGDFEAYKASHP